MNKLFKFTAITFLLTVLGQQIAVAADFDTSKYVNEQHSYIRKAMRNNGLKGLSVAIFTSDNIIWKDCFGKSTYKTPIDASTLFSIQSMSKNFTAMAVLFAIQDGLLDLDTPIIRYLPDFKVNSCFEASPEEKITLRMLLSHTAGFTHEAPVGNNYDFYSPSKQEHWSSIRETWLKFPVGSRYSYSNLGFDLAAQIVEYVSGMAFGDYLKEKIFLPLDMNNTTVDDQEFVANDNKTEGKIFMLKKGHYQIPLIGSGAVYSNLNDLIKYVQFQLNFGRINEEQLIERKYLEEMYQYHANNYGLGIGVNDLSDVLEQFDTYFLGHSGGGFGYGSTMAWIPEYDLGFVVLGNKPFGYESMLIEPFISYMTEAGRIDLQDSLTKGFRPDFKEDVYLGRAFDFVEPEHEISSTFEKKDMIGKYEVLQNVDDLKWYYKILRFFGAKLHRVKIIQRNDVLFMDGYFGFFELKEYQPGLFFTKDGEAFDIRSGTPTFRNIKLRKYSNR